MSDLIDRQDAIYALDEIESEVADGYGFQYEKWRKYFTELSSAQSDIKQATKLLSDFIESCPGGDSYLITPDGEELRTDWGYATEGIQLIHDWAERRSDG